MIHKVTAEEHALLQFEQRLLARGMGFIQASLNHWLATLEVVADEKHDEELLERVKAYRVLWAINDAAWVWSHVLRDPVLAKPLLETMDQSKLGWMQRKHGPIDGPTADYLLALGVPHK